jgi:hypothetical protein
VIEKKNIEKSCKKGKEGRMDDLTSLIPVIKRARGYRLYALSGRRYLDLSLSNGHNLLGHKPKLFVNNIKQVCEKGLLSNLPSIYGPRFLKALRVLFPAYQTFFTATSLADLLAVAGDALGQPLSPSDIHDPLQETNPAGTISVWRPFFSGNIPSEYLLPVIPSGLGPALFVLCVRQAVTPLPVPAHSPLVLAAAVHSLQLLRSLPLPEYYRPDLLAGSKTFRQKDIYVIPRCPEPEYRRVFTHFLAAGVVLPPRYPDPAILPFELSPGELQNLLSLFDNHDKEST